MAGQEGIAKTAELCTFFQQGKCRRGMRCPFLHPSPPSAPALQPHSLPWRNGSSPSMACERAIKQLFERGCMELSELEATAAAHQMHLPAAVSLRAQFARAAAPPAGGAGGCCDESVVGTLGSGCEDPALLKAFEAATADYLAAKGVEFTAQGAPQPSFFLNACVNGKEVKWLACLPFYGSAALLSSAAAPSGSLASKAAAFASAHGPGALLFLCGFGSEVACALEGTTLLDATPLEPGLLYKLSKQLQATQTPP